MFDSSTNSRSSLPACGLYIISLMTTGPMRGPLLAGQRCARRIGYSSPAALGQRPNDSPLAAAANSTWSMKFNSLPARIGLHQPDVVPFGAIEREVVARRVAGRGIEVVSSKTR